MALVALERGQERREAFCGVVRLAADPDRERAEYAVLVRSDLKGQGLGSALMHAVIDYARAQGIGEVFGTCCARTRPCSASPGASAFAPGRVADDPEVVEVRLPLGRGGKDLSAALRRLRRGARSRSVRNSTTCCGVRSAISPWRRSRVSVRLTVSIVRPR